MCKAAATYMINVKLLINRTIVVSRHITDLL